MISINEYLLSKSSMHVNSFSYDGFKKLLLGQNHDNSKLLNVLRQLDKFYKASEKAFTPVLSLLHEALQTGFTCPGERVSYANFKRLLPEPEKKCIICDTIFWSKDWVVFTIVNFKKLKVVRARFCEDRCILDKAKYDNYGGMAESMENNIVPWELADINNEPILGNEQILKEIESAI